MKPSFGQPGCWVVDLGREWRNDAKRFNLRGTWQSKQFQEACEGLVKVRTQRRRRRAFSEAFCGSRRVQFTDDMYVLDLGGRPLKFLSADRG